MSKLTQHENCKVEFTGEYCFIRDKSTLMVKGIGRKVKGVYHLIDESFGELIDKLRLYAEKWRKEEVDKPLKMSGNTQLRVPSEVNKSNKNKNMTTPLH